MYDFVYGEDDYDSPWKIALDNYLEEFLGFYFPEVSVLIDWRIEPKSLDSELQAVVKDSELGRNRADKLVEVTLKEGKTRLLNIHIEVQSQPDSSFERRMFTYFYRIFDKYGEPPLSLAVLADTNSRWQPKSFSQRQINNELKFEFATVKLLYKNGWNREKIVNFFAILDWLMQLPPIEALEFNTQLAQLEEEKKMRYVTSVERIGMHYEKGYKVE